MGDVAGLVDGEDVRRGDSEPVCKPHVMRVRRVAALIHTHRHKRGLARGLSGHNAGATSWATFYHPHPLLMPQKPIVDAAPKQCGDGLCAACRHGACLVKDDERSRRYSARIAEQDVSARR